MNEPKRNGVGLSKLSKFMRRPQDWPYSFSFLSVPSNQREEKNSK